MVRGMDEMNDEHIYKIAIVGFGPKGLYGLERLTAFLKDRAISKNVEVHIFNSTSFFGAGDVYRTDQPYCLIMNYANGNINVWPKQLPKPITNHTPDFVAWLKERNVKNSSTTDFAPRAKVGTYLNECYHNLISHLPVNVKVVPHIGWVVNVENSKQGFALYYTNEKKQESTIAVDQILFTTGHITYKSHIAPKRASENNIGFIYPTDKKLVVVAPGTSVAIKGMGLTCIDAVLGLTEGRGGNFIKNADNFFSYVASGQEPKQMHLFSRSGLPMVPRDGTPLDDKPLQFFTEKALIKIKARRPINFNETLLPLIKKEFYWAYYRTLFQQYGWELKGGIDFEKIRAQVVQFHKQFRDVAYFSWQHIVNPFAEKRNITNGELREYIQFLIHEAELGADKSPFIAAVSTWRKISPLFNELYSYGGLDAASHKEFDTFYFGLFNRLSYGPPIENMKKILALHTSGLLNFSFAKSVTVVKGNDDGEWSLFGEKRKKTKVQFLINATIPRAGQQGFENKLYQNLEKNKYITPFINSSSSTYHPGCIALNKNGNPVNEYGEVNKAFTFYGTPTEGITYDNDTLSRTRNDFATIWAKNICKVLQNKDRRIAHYEREEQVL
ncbi:FAD/NAD(P)-binding protein [Maribacter confluentis]|uniref:FAD/NAD(P)-binding protein n=1 Tax=Maribacter confluentis TaxID=1656093 RepID=A0ABT8RKY6_9FLAO|nr:FAD/NAD(P)-binding protein [Maribacter confluentis]MDO1511601.1 FAD/NAD(P)-binding protein [Maribacter confluentis]